MLMAKDTSEGYDSKCSKCDEETAGYPDCAVCGKQKEVAWCRFCKQQLRPRSILGNWKMCIGCGERGDHYTTTDPN